MALPPAAVPPKPPMGLPKSPIGGPSGPGGSPMVSPGTGAGMQADAQKKVSKVIDDLLAIGAAFPKGSPQFNGIVGAIGKLNSVFKGAPSPEAQKNPLPVPGTPPGGPPRAGLPPPSGGPAMPPGGGPLGPVGPGGPGGASPMVPGIEG